MRTYRGNAIAAGVLFILCSAASILSIVPLGAPVVAPVDFARLAANDDRVVLDRAHRVRLGRDRDGHRHRRCIRS